MHLHASVPCKEFAERLLECVGGETLGVVVVVGVVVGFVSNNFMGNSFSKLYPR